jgi:hypothetical protein
LELSSWLSKLDLSSSVCHVHQCSSLSSPTAAPLHVYLHSTSFRPPRANVWPSHTCTWASLADVSSTRLPIRCHCLHPPSLLLFLLFSFVGFCLLALLLFLFWVETFPSGSCLSILLVVVWLLIGDFDLASFGSGYVNLLLVRTPEGSLCFAFSSLCGPNNLFDQFSLVTLFQHCLLAG